MREVLGAQSRELWGVLLCTGVYLRGRLEFKEYEGAEWKGTVRYKGE